MSLKMEFVGRANGGEKVAALCREFNISRETGHKWLRRFREQGYDGLEEQSRRPKSSPLAKAEQVVMALLEAREAHPRWGPKKLIVLVERKLGGQAPSRATAARILKQFGKVRERRKKAPVCVVDRAPTVVAAAPNEVWTVDFKGWWPTEDGTHCEPLTVRDAFSRFVLAARRMEGTRAAPVRAEFERLFRKYGIPRAIQCDNGPPFVCRRARGGLTRLSAWWVSLGIRLVRSRPACPQDNGGHERMHRDVRADVQAARGANPRAAQRRLDRWRQEFNHVRPHEALGGKVPADLYQPGARRSLLVAPHTYPPTWITRNVCGPCGRIRLHNQMYPIGSALRGHQVALEPISGLRHRLWFRHHDLGELELSPPQEIIDEVCDRFLDRPLGPKKKYATARRGTDTKNPKT